MNISEWSEEFPTEPGNYWFYGNPWFGSMGCDYFDDAKPDMRMYLVRVHQTGNSVLGTTEGQIFYRQKFNKEKHQQGYIGKFAKADVPEPPDT